MRKFSHDEARRLRAQGWTQQQIADHFGVSRCAVQNALGGTRRGRPDPVAVPRVSFWTPWVSKCNPDAAKDQPEPGASAWHRGVGSGQGTIHRRTRGALPERER